jgi:hypothetical protein
MAINANNMKLTWEASRNGFEKESEKDDFVLANYLHSVSEKGRSASMATPEG